MTDVAYQEGYRPLRWQVRSAVNDVLNQLVKDYGSLFKIDCEFIAAVWRKLGYAGGLGALPSSFRIQREGWTATDLLEVDNRIKKMAKVATQRLRRNGRIKWLKLNRAWEVIRTW